MCATAGRRGAGAPPAEARLGTDPLDEDPVSHDPRARMATSVDDRLVDELAVEVAVVEAQRARRLHHEDRRQLLLRIDPEEPPRVAAPGEIAGRAWHRR